MAKFQQLLCFTIIFSSVTLLEVVSAQLKIKPALPQIEDPKTVKDVEAYTVKVVMVFVSDLEKECPKTSKFKAFFEKLRAFAKYVCPIKRNDQADYEKDMKAKAGGLFKTIASFAIGRVRKEIQDEKQDAIDTFRFMKSLAGRIIGGRKKDESEENMKLTAEQQKEIKEGILKWETVITRIANTMVQTTTTSSSSSSENGNSIETSKSLKDTAGGGFNSPTTSGSPSNSPSRSSSFGQNSTATVEQIEAETSKDVMTFIMNLEKKCPQKEEYKGFFEKLKATMTFPSKASPRKRIGLFARIKSGAGKLSDAMAFIRSRIGTKSAEVKKSIENYQGEVVKTMEELDAIYSKIVSQNKGKKEGSLTLTAEQQKEIKVTITKWEQVTTQFVETCVQSETQSSSPSSSSSLGKIKAN